MKRMFVKSPAVQARRRTTPDGTSAHARESAHTRAAILAAARELFAADGFDTVTIRDIVARAGANLAAINYHFRSKEDLIYSILQDALHRFEDALAPWDDATIAPRERVRRVTRLFFETAKNERVAFRIFVKAMAREPECLSDAAVASMTRHRAVIDRAIEDGVRNGEFRRVDPFLATTTLIAMCVYYHQAAPLLARQLGTRELSPAFLEQALDFTLETFFATLAAPTG